MATEKESFETLVKEAPLAPTAGTVSLVGTLGRSAETGKFVLVLQDGRAMTLETAAVKGYKVLGTSIGQTIVRIDVDAEKVRPEAEVREGPYGFGSQVQAGAVAPFALATLQQVPSPILAALQVPNLTAVWWTFPFGMDAGGTYSWEDNPYTNPLRDGFATGGPQPD